MCNVASRELSFFFKIDHIILQNCMTTWLAPGYYVFSAFDLFASLFSNAVNGDRRVCVDLAGCVEPKFGAVFFEFGELRNKKE